MSRPMFVLVVPTLVKISENWILVNMLLLVPLVEHSIWSEEEILEPEISRYILPSGELWNKSDFLASHSWRSRWNVESWFQRTNLWRLPISPTSNSGTKCVGITGDSLFDSGCLGIGYFATRNLGNDSQVHVWSNQNPRQAWWTDIGRYQTVLCCCWTWRMEIRHTLRSLRYPYHHSSRHFLFDQEKGWLARRKNERRLVLITFYGF